MMPRLVAGYGYAMVALQCTSGAVSHWRDGAFTCGRVVVCIVMRPWHSVAALLLLASYQWREYDESTQLM
jgi:heme A synthase